MKTSDAVSETFELLPFNLRPERAEIISRALRQVAITPTIFAEAACDEGCIEKDRSLPEMCPSCVSRMRQVSQVLSAADTVAFEVWDTEALVGLIFFTDVTAIDAVGHYVFFDRDLASKTAVMEEAIAEMFDAGLTRLTVEIPAPFASLIRHASRKLGFGGPFAHEVLKSSGRGVKVKVEGVKRHAALWRGEMVDLLILGRTSEAKAHTHEGPHPASSASTPATHAVDG